ncbi:MAG: DUF4397 domain-containing protein [bacterium]
MRRIIPLSVLLAVGAVNACSTPDALKPTQAIPTAGIRFINAVPDTGAAYGLDFRFVDIVESNAQFRVPFRNAMSATAPFVPTLTEYKPTMEGARHFRVFLDDTLQAVASTVIKDSTISATATHNYTVMLWGNARSTGADKMKLTVWDETVADPGAQVALRVVNTTDSPIDVRVYAQGGTAPVAATWAAVPAYSASSYSDFPKGSYMYNVQPAGGGTSLFADALAIPGTPGTVDIESIPGTNVAGTAVSAFVFPRSVVGSKAPQSAAFAVPAIGFNWDRRPPRTCSPLC